MSKSMYSLFSYSQVPYKLEKPKHSKYSKPKILFKRIWGKLSERKEITQENAWWSIIHLHFSKFLVFQYNFERPLS